MQAAVFKALGRPLSVKVPDPVPGPAEVLVKVSRCGICGTDLHITEDPIFCAVCRGRAAPVREAPVEGLVGERCLGRAFGRRIGAWAPGTSQ